MTSVDIEIFFTTYVKGTRSGSNDQRYGRCPFHDDKAASFSFNIEKGVWKCHAGCGEGGLKDFASKLALPESSVPYLNDHNSTHEIVAIYDYRDETGNLLFQAVRYAPKNFKQRRPDGAGGWLYKLGDVRRVPYRLPELLEAAKQSRRVFVAEGEKDVENLLAHGLTATCNPMGAGKWRDEYNRHFAHLHVVIIPDNDEPGRDHARRVAASLRTVAASVKLLELPGLTKKGEDVSDWLANGHSVQELTALADNTPIYFDDAATASGEFDYADDELPPGFTDDTLALKFTAKHAEDWRYVAPWNQWLHWDGACWKEEKTLKAFDLAREVCRGEALQQDKPNIAARIASSTTVYAVERLARADRKHAATTDQWDADPWLLNTPGGVVDLRTGKLRPHDRADYFTKITRGQPGTTCPAWLEFLRDITGGDEDLPGYLERIAGYALTGETSEHALFFLHGTGGNGKGVFLNTIAKVIGDYALTAPTDTFLETKGDRHPTDLAALRGARMVIASEVDQGRRWAEAKLKSLTGGDTISARFMRQDFFEYRPQFKLFVAGNHKPAIRGVDEAMRRRLHLVPFTVTIPADKRDNHLGERLLAERDGILGWAIQGCLEWQRIGLQPPEAVLGATRDYFTAEDALGRWLEEACRQDANATATTKILFAAWKAWGEAAEEYVGSEKWFATELEARGFKKWVEPGTRHHGFRGLSLL